MALNISNPVADTTTYSSLPVVDQMRQAIEVAAEFCSNPVQATAIENMEWNADTAAQVASGFYDWFGDEISGEDFSPEIRKTLMQTARYAFEIFTTDRAAIGRAIAMTTVTLVPLSQR